MYEKLFFGSSGSIYEFARELRLEITKAEKILWNKLRNRRLKGYKFRRQHPIVNYIVDFYCLERSLSIEIDGKIHLSKEQSKYDKERTAYLKELGIKEIRFTNEEVFKDIHGVLEKILKELK